ncbi:hypothetical protein OH77DRAFT_1435937 [Trametes cingulata]|nr:hypothetical protein OH77DRAFT_1435937 [Trametes cingulata]
MEGLQVPGGQIRLDDTLGAAFMGHFVTTVLYGITTLQAFMYYRRHHRDTPALKFSVLVLWLLDSLHAGLITGAMYWYCITNFTNLLAIQRPIWPIPTMVLVSNISNSIVLTFRTASSATAYGNAFLSVFIFVDATYFTAKLYNISSYAEISDFSWSLYLGLSVEATVDLIVALAQCVLLRSFETGIRRTDMVIRVLITYSINTGLLTSMCAIGALVSYAAEPTKFIYFAFYFVLSKLYVNSLLATLNARGSLHGTRTRRRPSGALSGGGGGGGGGGGVQSKIAFRTPTLTMSTDPSSSYDPSSSDPEAGGGGIEFTTVIVGETASADEIVQSVHSEYAMDKRDAFP